jgi:hypothetical protein
LRAIGNIEKRALINGLDAIEKEVDAKLSMAMEGGTYQASITRYQPMFPSRTMSIM